MVQKSEKILKKSLEPLDVWFMKIQNIHMTSTPADFIVLNKYRYLVEVKEISLYKGYKSFSFDRLTQEQDLIYFDNKKEQNHSYILINFRERTLKNSYIFLIPIFDYLKIKNSIDKKSLNLNDFLKFFKHNQLTILTGSILNLKEYFI